MLKNKLNAHGGFTPAVLCSPEMRYNLERVLRHHHDKCRGGMRGGDRQGRLRYLTRARYFTSQNSEAQLPSQPPRVAGVQEPGQID
jgi:hypothetical protein